LVNVTIMSSRDTER